MFDFTNATALIVGGGSGIGKEIAIALCKNGADVVITGRNEDKLNSVKKKIDILGKGLCYSISSDVRSEESVKGLMSAVSDIFSGKLNILVNSAGTNIRAPIEDVSLKDFQEVIDVNLTGTFLTTKLAHPLLAAADYGRVINLASIFSTVTFPHRLSYSSINAVFGVEKETSYSMAKSAILQLTRSLAAEVRKDGINVNCIVPGPVKTGRFMATLKGRHAHDLEMLKDKSRLERVALPQDISPLVDFLISPGSDFISGSVIKIDGGLFNQAM